LDGKVFSLSLKGARYNKMGSETDIMAQRILELKDEINLSA